MGAPSTIYINNYVNDIKHLAQQEASLLRNTVMVDYDFNGEYKFYNQLGASTSMNERKATAEDTKYRDMNHDRRRLGKRYFADATLWDDYDQVNTNLVPTSAYSQNLVMMANNTVDERIIEAVTGTSYSGKAGGTSTTLPAANIIANGGTGLTLAKILQAASILNKGNVKMNEEKYFIISPDDVTDLMNEIKYTSRDYVDFGALQKGQIAPFHGFNFIMSNLLSYNTSTKVTKCLVYCKSGIQLGISRDISVSVDKVPTKWNNIQIMVKQALDATRLEEAKVVEVDTYHA